MAPALGGVALIALGVDTKRRGAALSLLDDTEVGKIQQAAQQIETLRDLLADPAFQDADSANKIIDAMERLKDIAEGSGDAVKSEFDKIADTIEKSMDRSTDAILDFVVDGSGSLGDIWKAFRRDVMRALIEDPVREVMKNVVKDIKRIFSELGEGGGGGILDNILKFIGGGSGGGDFDIFKSLGSLFGFTSRANGGSVRAGQMVRLNESGIESAVFDRDATILNARQTRQSMQGGGSQLVYQPTIHVNGDVSAQTVALVQNMLARNNAQLVRSMRTGGAFAS